MNEQELRKLAGQLYDQLKISDIEKISELSEKADELEYCLTQERVAANHLLAKIAMWGHKTVGQTLPQELSDAIFEFEIERRCDTVRPVLLEGSDA